MQKREIYILVSLIFLVFQLLVSGCGGSESPKYISSFSHDTNSTSLDINRTFQISVYGHYEDGTYKDMTQELVWSSSDTTLATVEGGLIQTYTTLGDVLISYETAQIDGDGSPFYKESIGFEVKELTLTQITLSKTTLSLSVGASTQITATGTFEDNGTLSTQNITHDCNWKSAEPSIATASNGFITAIDEGNTTITASDSNLSASLDLEVIQPEYTSVSIYASKTEFNVEQTISLEARGITQEGSTVILEDTAVTWSSASESIVSMEENIATAIAKGDASISVTLPLSDGTSLSSSLTLSVVKDNYLRIFKDDEELTFPYVASETNSSFGTTLDTFTLRAVGDDFIVRVLYVHDFSGAETPSGYAYFDGLELSQALDAENNVSFTLMRDTSISNVHYFFDINDSTKSSFSQKYELTD